MDRGISYSNVQGSIAHRCKRTKRSPCSILTVTLLQDPSYLYVCGESNWRLALTEDSTDITTDMAEGCEV